MPITGLLVTFVWQSLLCQSVERPSGYTVALVAMPVHPYTTASNLDCKLWAFLLFDTVKFSYFCAFCTHSSILQSIYMFQFLLISQFALPCKVKSREGNTNHPWSVTAEVAEHLLTFSVDAILVFGAPPVCFVTPIYESIELEFYTMSASDVDTCLCRHYWLFFSQLVSHNLNPMASNARSWDAQGRTMPLSH